VEPRLGGAARCEPAHRVRRALGLRTGRPLRRARELRPDRTGRERAHADDGRAGSAPRQDGRQPRGLHRRAVPGRGHPECAARAGPDGTRPARGHLEPGRARDAARLRAELVPGDGQGAPAHGQHAPCDRTVRNLPGERRLGGDRCGQSADVPARAARDRPGGAARRRGVPRAGSPGDALRRGEPALAGVRREAHARRAPADLRAGRHRLRQGALDRGRGTKSAARAPRHVGRGRAPRRRGAGSDQRDPDPVSRRARGAPLRRAEPRRAQRRDFARVSGPLRRGARRARSARAETPSGPRTCAPT
jgi:hypothetical protein